MNSFYSITTIMITKNGVLEESSTNYNNVGLSRLNWYPSAGSRQQAAGSRQQAAGSRQQAAVATRH
jgi:hypothetical protein